MSDLRVASIAGLNGTSPATLVKQSAAKAWAHWDGTGTIALLDSFNVSSLVDLGTGSYRLNWSSGFLNANYSSSGAGRSYLLTGAAGNQTTSLCQIFVANSSGTALDDTNNSTSHFGDLA